MKGYGTPQHSSALVKVERPLCHKIQGIFDGTEKLVGTSHPKTGTSVLVTLFKWVILANPVLNTILMRRSARMTKAEGIRGPIIATTEYRYIAFSVKA